MTYERSLISYAINDYIVFLDQFPQFYICSFVNAKNWKGKLYTSEENNTQLMSELQESTANVDAGKCQLQLYKEQNNKLKVGLTKFRESRGIKKTNSIST